MLVIVDGALAGLLHVPWGHGKLGKAVGKATVKAYFPLGFIYLPLWWSFLAFHAVAPVAHRVFRENGVCFNDFDTFRRANRYHVARA